jgi:arsenical pump membrane protein
VVGSQIGELLPAVAFLAAAVPLAALLGRLGFFDAIADTMAARGRPIPVALLWVLAAVTTIVLNLDTTVVLLTPLYLRLARRADVDPWPLVGIPLLLASLASSVLPVSNLTTLIAVEQLHLSVGDVLSTLAIPSLVACGVGWLMYRRRHPISLPVAPAGTADRRAWRVGGAVVAFLLVGFTAGAAVGIPAWVVALVGDVVLVGVTGWLPWRHLPILTIVGVLAVAAAVALVVPTSALHGWLDHDNALALVVVTASATAAADLVNNLPALLVGLGDRHAATWGTWAWLLGVNTGAVLLPLGALANLLWRRVLRTEELTTDLARYVRLTLPVALPALGAAAATLALERVVRGA